MLVILHLCQRRYNNLQAARCLYVMRIHPYLYLILSSLQTALQSNESFLMELAVATASFALQFQEVEPLGSGMTGIVYALDQVRRRWCSEPDQQRA